jgi:hypothetical protein
MKCKIDNPHPDVMEREKMKWMEDVPASVKPLPDALFNARFDFEGNI